MGAGLLAQGAGWLHPQLARVIVRLGNMGIAELPSEIARELAQSRVSEASPLVM